MAASSRGPGNSGTARASRYDSATADSGLASMLEGCAARAGEATARSAVHDSQVPLVTWRLPLADERAGPAPLVALRSPPRRVMVGAANARHPPHSTIGSGHDAAVDDSWPCRTVGARRSGDRSAGCYGARERGCAAG